ncbi:MAG: hypothetical protein H7145_21165 [Akkermansiaceae bacterium]|nr:hypothetical protein [Armatimonadota bacterium]
MDFEADRTKTGMTASFFFGGKDGGVAFAVDTTVWEVAGAAMLPMMSSMLQAMSALFFTISHIPFSRTVKYDALLRAGNF